MLNGKKVNVKYEIHISGGNMKVGRIPNFSLAPGRTCSPEACRTCLKEGCYACKSYKMYPNVRNAWDDNTVAALDDLAETEARLIAWIGKKKPVFFRVHVAGDFVTRKYAEMWARVAADCPDTRFLAFTKYWDHVRGVAFPDNFSLVLSGWPGTEIPADLKAQYPTANMIETLADHDESAILCPGNCENCGVCWSLAQKGMNVEFLKH